MSVKSDLLAAKAMIDTPEKWGQGGMEVSGCLCGMSLTREKLQTFFTVLDALHVVPDDPADKMLINLAAHRIDFFADELGSRLRDGETGSFWQTPFGDLITDGEGHWRLTD